MEPNPYDKMSKKELIALLKARKLPYQGTKALLVVKLLESDALSRSDDPPLPKHVTGAMEDPDPTAFLDILRKFVHDDNIRKNAKKLLAGPYSERVIINVQKLRGGGCLERTCSHCGSGTLWESMNHTYGVRSKCRDQSCQDMLGCANCRKKLQDIEEQWHRRKQDSCSDGSCGDLHECFRCETYIRNAIVPTSLPEHLQGPYDPVNEAGDMEEAKLSLDEMRRSVHNAHIRKLGQKLQNTLPYACEWIAIKQLLGDGKCLGTGCSLRGTSLFGDSLKILSDGPDIDCGGESSGLCSNPHGCPSCRDEMQFLDDAVARDHTGKCNSGKCYIVHACIGCKARLQPGANRDESIPDAISISSSDDESAPGDHCMSGQHGGNLVAELGRCDGPDPSKPEGLGCCLYDCLRCGMIEAKTGPRMRNDALKRLRANNNITNSTDSRQPINNSSARKRSFDDHDLHYYLPASHPLAQRIFDEKHRETLQRQGARFDGDQLGWFGTQQDPLPDFWMGRPILPDREISILKATTSIPKYYLSQSEEDLITHSESLQEKRLGIVVRRLEAELMSRDFWMQSLGYDARDDGGDLPGGRYIVSHASSGSLAKKR
ncbi:hypothetical protein AUEXF2481DRAFT_460743 [Aureobasidium subglaciale EXF-2481]|uniref:SAP domain-containing protein n=1 Tax=Aureobasidium subglaciale (strain EXF-2481) TaxID=1043005 RepID=A0A074Y1N5_AURSE|nr:uncharacterized protein AUEXF2481DRAFT_460743 [Aureobasidium subglaciale EXF-2481]KEQ91713.1 hypothetical protein AUEXF2481DRAFT_460743 [Aureobasidium subglaciale EXF-2481]